MKAGCDNIMFAVIMQFRQKQRNSSGTFHIGCKVENVVDRAKSATLSKMLINTGSEYTWITEGPSWKGSASTREKKDLAFIMANGQTITRSVGFAIVRVGTAFTVDEVVFAEKGDLLLGPETLEGLNLTIEPRQKKLVAAGPLSAA